MTNADGRTARSVARTALGKSSGNVPPATRPAGNSDSTVRARRRPARVVAVKYEEGGRGEKDRRRAAATRTSPTDAAWSQIVRGPTESGSRPSLPVHSSPRSPPERDSQPASGAEAIHGSRSSPL